MRIGIAGAGAIGGWIGVRLAAAGHDVSVLARGAALEAIRSAPWCLEMDGTSLAARVRAESDGGAIGIQDVVIVALKAQALPAAVASIKPMIGPETIVVPAMNGVPWWFLLDGAGELPATSLRSVDPDSAIEAAIPFSAVLGCVVHASAAIVRPGLVSHRAGNRLILGEPRGASSRLDRVAALFDQAGFEVERSTDIRRDIWYKLWGNMTMNPVSALTGATCDRILDDPLVAAFVLRVMSEAQEIGAGIGAPITERGEDRNAVTRRLGAFRTSMLQDVEAGRTIELDALLGAPKEIAGLLGMATPNLDALLGLCRLFGRVRDLY